jgi:TRAP-type mannitol/chloroaromatic compound transport system substrate-binding protein
LIDISISQKKWDKMPEDLQQILKTSVRDFSYDITTQLKIADQAAVKEANANPKITIHNWSDEERKKFRSIAREQWKVFAERSPNAQKVYESVTTFLEKNDLL